MTNKKSIEDLSELLEEDNERSEPRYPNAARLALKDAQVRETLQDQFGDEKSLIDIRSIGYNYYTGLNHTVFVFKDHSGIELEPSAVLVVSRPEGEVVGVVDEYDIARPSQTSSLPSTAGDQPFVLQNPTVSDRLIFPEEDLIPSRLRSRKFFDRMGVLGEMTGTTQGTTYNTMVGYSCKQFTGLFVPQCDSSGPDYEVDEKADTVNDDVQYGGLL